MERWDGFLPPAEGEAIAWGCVFFASNTVYAGIVFKGRRGEVAESGPFSPKVVLRPCAGS